MKRGDKLGLGGILKEIKAGLTPAEISKKYNIPKTTLDYSVGKLKKLGCIEKLGYASWRWIKDLEKYENRPKGSSRAKLGLLKPIRGHAFIWTINFPGHKYDWPQIVKNYKKRHKKPKLNFNLICNKKVIRTIFKNRKVWLTNNGMTIYEPLDFYGKSSFSVKGMAVFEMDRLIKDLLKELKQPFNKYFFNCSREHFAHVHNQIAKQFNDKKKKIKVEWDGKHFWIDHSDHVHEEETDDTKVSVQAHKFYKDQVKTRFEVTPSFVTNSLNTLTQNVNQNTQNLGDYALHLKSHVESVQKLGTAVEELTKVVKEMNK